MSRTAIIAAALAAVAAWLSFGTVAALDSGVRIGVLPSPWVLAAGAVLAAVAAIVLRVSSQTALPLFFSLLAVLPWLPIPVPDLFLVWTGPAVALLWCGIALSMIAIVSQRVKGRWRGALKDHRSAPYTAALLAFIVFLSVRLARGGPPTGDEPHYLLMTQSILEDGDLDVANNYDRHDYSAYYGGVLLPHVGQPGLNGAQYSIHAPGVAAVVAPAFRVAGYRGVVVWIAALVALGSALVWKSGYVLTGDAGAAWFGWCAVTLTAPVVLYGSLVYPDPLGAVMIAGGTYALVLAHQRISAFKNARDLWRSFVVGLGIGLLPWLHTRLALPALALAIVLLVRLGMAARNHAADWTHFAGVAIPVAGLFAAWFGFFRVLYGTFSPSAPYGNHLPVGFAYVGTGLLGLFADQQFGILPNAPIYVLCAAGLWSLFRTDRRLCVELLFVTVPYVLASSGFPLWFGGAAPPARFLVPVVLPVGLAFAVLWARQDTVGRSMSLGLLGLSVLIAGALAFGSDGALAYNDTTGHARWLDWLAPLVDLPRGLPSFFRGEAALVPTAAALVANLVEPAVVWTFAILGGGLVFRALAERLPKTAGSRTLATVCCGLAVASAAVVINWRLARATPLTSTRSQLRLLRNDDPRICPIGVYLPALRTFSGPDARAHLAIEASRVDGSRDTLLHLDDVPAGDYRLHVNTRTPLVGNVFVRIGRGTGVVWQGSIQDNSAGRIVLHLPVLVSSLTIEGDDRAMRSVDTVSLLPELRRGGAIDEPARARDAVRYGSMVVFALDDRVTLDSKGLSVLGTRQADVVVEPESETPAIDIAVTNVAVENQIRLTAGEWSVQRTLAPGEATEIRVPVPRLFEPFRVAIQASSALPAHEGSLGCRIEFR